MGFPLAVGTLGELALPPESLLVDGPRNPRVPTGPPHDEEETP